MRRRKLGFGGSSALGWSLGVAVAAACNVYDSSLLTGGSEGQGGSAAAGTGSSGDSGTGAGGTGGKGGAQGGGTGGVSGTGMDGGDGGTDPTGGTGTGGSTGGTSGTTGGTGKGGSTPTGGDAGDTSTGGKGGSAGDGGSGPSGGSGGSGGDAGGSAGACGKCGCGKAETPDTDGDGVLDCNDMCPDFNDADCAVLKGGLVHRYSFTGAAMSTAVMDTKGTAHGTAMGTGVGLSGSGTLVLPGGGTAAADPKQYVDLPDNLLSGLTNATFEAFITWTPDATASNNQWHRVFDFGSAATTSTGSYIFLTPKTGTSATSGGRLAIATAGATSETAAGGAQSNCPAVAAGAHHLVAIVDDTNDTVSLYLDGTLGSTVSFTGTFSAINSVNNWLGRSNYSVDRYFAGTYDEFRIYNVALTAAQLRTSRMAGPNPAFL